MPNPDDLISSAEAAELLGIDRSTFTRWVDRGRIAPAVTMTGLRGPRLFLRTAVEALRTEAESA